MITKPLSGRSATWFIFDDIASVGKYQVMMFDKDEEEITRDVGGINFSERRFPDVYTAKTVAMNAAIADNKEGRMYPVKTLKVVSVEAEADVTTDVTINWNN